MKFWIPFIVLLLFLTQGCSEEELAENTTSQTVQLISQNDDGASELRVFMREIFTDAWKARKQIKKGELGRIKLDIEKINYLKASEPSKEGETATKEFKAYRQSYISAVKNLNQADPSNIKMLFNGMVATCMNCHEPNCPGPMVRIKKLYIK